MRLRNKRTREIGRLSHVGTDGKLCIMTPDGVAYYYDSLADINKDWEDYEEPKEYWYIDTIEGSVVEHSCEGFELTDKERKEIGNYFETKEEAEKAVEKLKAWKRLEDTYHISFDLDFVKNIISFTYRIDGTLHSVINEERIIFEDMKTIFGGQE